ncbi:type II toxin-antitoxin system VapB family antitoxin [Rhodoplanes elegans]|uniref:type II toxin-antitoxin system VapB family antitoxin n=1 Tax=Rhodoplanes elegans TaxID=29408 RepID=UPI001474A929|nr:type II toxin-antitoxin system VapB family antitoxin [Rhodoplanes elegans]
MTLNIRDPRADALARQIAEIDRTSVTEAVVGALEEALAARLRKESPRETARRILERRGLAFVADRKPVPPAAYHDLDHERDGER